MAIKNKKATKKLNSKKMSKKPVRHAPVRQAKKALKAKASKKTFKQAKKAISKAKVHPKAVVPRKERAKKEKVVAPDFRAMTVADEALIGAVVSNEHFSNHVSRSVGKRAKEIIQLLAEPQTDDAVAEKLGIKINEVRRMLNTLNTYGVTRYNVNKDSKGWLTFKWYIDANKLTELKEQIVLRSGEGSYKLPEGCNDFFICNKCYAEEKTIFPFDTALEMNFKHECGGVMKQVNKMEAEQLITQEGRLL
ncbi:MAG: hypothetical protein KGH71_02035 [Candidatus Micrarchaeota archaeon]|nr:hypothetical protein [Candidatus Micrarchaeota archaeon]